MLNRKQTQKLKMMMLITGILITGLLTQADLTSKAALMPTASMSIVPSTPKVGQNTQFMIQVSPASDAGCIDAQWILDFDDGSSTAGSTSGNVVHVYQNEADFSPTLTYTRYENVGDERRPDCQAEQVVVTRRFTVEPLTPFTVIANVSEGIKLAGSPMTFDNEGTGTDASCLFFGPVNWDFGDGTSGVGSPIDKIYQASGTYTVTLSMTDGCGRSGSASIVIGVYVATATDDGVLPETNNFLGINENWYDPINWSLGVVPGPEGAPFVSDAVLVTVDPDFASEPNPGVVAVRNLTLGEGARLETRPGVDMTVDVLELTPHSEIFLLDSSLKARHAIIKSTPPSAQAARQMQASPLRPGGGWGCTWCGGVLGNPSFIEFEEAEFEHAIISLLLGGAEPATEDLQGVGTYANIRGRVISLTNTYLQFDLKYEYQPQPGDRFVLIEASESLSGQFEDMDHGDVVGTIGALDYVVLYETNQVILVAQSQ